MGRSPEALAAAFDLPFAIEFVRAATPVTSRHPSDPPSGENPPPQLRRARPPDVSSRRKVDAHVAAGEVTTHESAEDFMTHLEKLQSE